MAKPKTAYVCAECGAHSLKWAGQCPDCGAWNTLSEVRVAGTAASSGAAAAGLDALQLDPEERYATGFAEFDRVLGGGLVPGAVVLLGGDPGVRAAQHRGERGLAAGDTLLVIQKKKVGALPVIDEEGYLKGIMSTRDLLTAFVNVLNIDEPGSLLCIIVTEQPGQMKKIVDIVTEENISLGSVLVARYWDENKRAVFTYLLTQNVAQVKKKLKHLGFTLLDPMEWYLDQLPKNELQPEATD